MQVQITAPFFFQNNWFFAESPPVTGPTAKAALAAGCGEEIKVTRNKKSLKGAPENKDMANG